MAQDVETWRAKLIGSFPDLRPEFDDPETTIYGAFIELSAKCQNAHDRDDDAVLATIYDFAAWCSRQKEKDLWNAAGVSFYEHIIDHPKALRDFPHWVPPDVFHQVSTLLQWRMGDDEFSKLNARYAQDRLKATR
jgi:hypothetical protein